MKDSIKQKIALTLLSVLVGLVLAYIAKYSLNSSLSIIDHMTIHPL